VVGGLGNLEDAADIGDGLALGDQLISCFELADDLLGCVESSFHGAVPSLVWPDEDSHSPWTDSQGPRQKTLEMALSSGRRPQILHSIKGCQFTSTDFVARLQAEEIKISWTERKRCYANILVERLWRTLKYEEVYLRAYSDDWDAEISLARFLWRYCHVRPHSSLGGKTPYAIYTETEPSPSRPQLTISGAKAVQ
jgi:hypothetical protein